MKTLIGMAAFVLEQKAPHKLDKIDLFDKCVNYANFLSRQPQLSDFVPCNDNNEPIEYNKTASEIFADDNGHCRIISKEESAYIKALDKVLFKGFEIFEFKGEYRDYPTEKKAKIYSYSSLRYKGEIIVMLSVEGNPFEDITIEYLTPYNLELTENANKSIGV